MTTHHIVDEDRPAVSYGPRPDGDGWVLALTCEDERVEISLDEDAMYDLWVEVRGVPWPNPGDAEKDRLVRQLIHAANGADVEMLQDALEAMGVGSA